MRINIDRIVADPQAQPRAMVDDYTIGEYRADMLAGDKFPPVVVFSNGDGKYYLADGWHRYRASQGIADELDADVREGGLREAVLYSCQVNSEHGKRRTNGDKKRAVMKLLKDPEWAAWSDNEIARRCRVSSPTVAKYRSSISKSFIDGPKKVERGGKVYEMDTSAIGKPAAQPVMEIPTEPAPVLPAVVNWELYTAPVSEVAQHVEAGSIDAIITDPPYPKEYIPQWGELAELASIVLKPGGILVALGGHPHLPTILPLMADHIQFHWMGCYYMPTGPHASLPYYNVSVYWKPVLIFVNGVWPNRTFKDVFVNDQADKDHHHWGQGVSGFERLVEAFTFPNDTVLDPFVGGGTTGVAAVKNGRYFIGADIQADEVEKTRSRLYDLSI